MRFRSILARHCADLEAFAQDQGLTRLYMRFELIGAQYPETYFPDCWDLVRDPFLSLFVQRWG
jgi:hypothetical protein